MLICPICDSALRGRFCPVCKKLVKEPWVLDDRIYINRSHSLPDNFCEYHGNDRKVTYLNRTADKKSPLISGRQMFCRKISVLRLKSPLECQILL